MKTTRIIGNKVENFPVSENQIFIGEITGSPAVGKIFAKRMEYLSVVEEIKEAVKYKELFNQTKNSTAILVLKGYIEVEIVEKEKHVFISVCFERKPDNAGFSGLTDKKGIGYTKFIESYNRQVPVLVSLICYETHEETLIIGAKNVRLTIL